MSPMQWQAFGYICGAILAALTLARFLYTKVVRPMFRGLKRLGQMADLFLGDKNADPPVPSLPEQVRSLRHQLGEHVAEYHARPAASNGANVTMPSRRRT